MAGGEGKVRVKYDSRFWVGQGGKVVPLPEKMNLKRKKKKNGGWKMMNFEYIRLPLWNYPGTKNQVGWKVWAQHFPSAQMGQRISDGMKAQWIF